MALNCKQMFRFFSAKHLLPVVFLPIIVVIFSSVQLFAQPITRLDETVRKGDALSPDINIHFTGKYCNECHLKSPKKGGDIFLRHGNDFIQTCRCHGYSAGTYIHPVDIFPTADKLAIMPATFPLQDGKMTCLSCHDIALQCYRDPKTAQRNKTFLRGAPYSSRTALCYQCHQISKYNRRDPHNQLDQNGEIIEEKCLYCHESKPDEQHATYSGSGIHAEVVTLIGKLDVLCYRCHYKQSHHHPINAEHFKQPPAAIADNMKRTEKRHGIILPLDKEGKITCATCHNPHERGVIPPGRPAAKGAGEKYRLRLPGRSGQICQGCHNK